jgi:hypothetical protein
MSIRKIIDWAAAQSEGEMTGTIASPFFQLYDDAEGWVWACDVDIGQPEVLRSVPVASNNREIIYAEEGKSVALKKMNQGRWVIAGLAKTVRSTTHIIYVSFEEDLASIVGHTLTGYLVRPFTYGELGALSPGGYGSLPYGARGRFDAQGSLVEILES